VISLLPLGERTKAYHGFPSGSALIPLLDIETLFRSNAAYGIMKIISATTETPAMTNEEVDRFLESKLMLQMSTIDEQGEPNIQPVWFYYDKNREKLLITTSKLAKKTQNLRKKPILYFSIDDENFPYKGVKGKGSVNIVEDPGRTVTEGDQISMKYLGTLDHPIAKMITEHSKKGENVIIEISPKFFSTWDYGKMQ
jgi:nitroimidazol reductase NimA-like FMN-containing flavoprotein (pyridoxamine 5'-phosphate oxidase superfamily)